MTVPQEVLIKFTLFLLHFVLKSRLHVRQEFILLLAIKNPKAFGVNPGCYCDDVFRNIPSVSRESSISYFAAIFLKFQSF